MFGGMFGGGPKLHESWNELNELDQLDQIIDNSNAKKQVLFKHSTRCSISSMAFNRLVSKWESKSGQADFYYLDLIAHRDISNAIADRFGVHHESPQILVIENGKCVTNASHNQVSVEAVG